MTTNIHSPIRKIITSAFILLSTFNGNVSAQTPFEDFLKLGPPRQPHPTAFYSPKFLKGDAYYNVYVRPRKKSINQIENIATSNQDKVIIYDSSGEPIIDFAQSDKSIDFNLINSTLIVQRNNKTYQIPIEYNNSTDELKTYFDNQKASIVELLTENFDGFGSTPAKIQIEASGENFNWYILNSKESSKDQLKLQSFGFRGDIADFQNAVGIKATGLIDSETSTALKDYFKLCESVVLPATNGNYISIFGYDKYLVEKEGQIMVLEKDEIYRLRALTSNDVLAIEREKQNSIYLAKSDKHLIISVNSRDNNTQKAGIIFDGELIQTNWNNTVNFDEIVTIIDNFLRTNPDKKNVILVRDIFNSNNLAINQLNSNAITGDVTLSNKYVDDRTWANDTELLRLLVNKYPDKRILLSSHTTRAGILQDITKSETTPIIRSSNDIAAYIVPKSFDVEGDQINFMRNTLVSGKIPVFELDESILSLPAEANKSNVLLLSGHKNDAYEVFLRKMADNGLLTGKIIGLFSCNEKGTSNLYSYLIRKGAKQVISFPTKISIPATRAVLTEVSKISTVIFDTNHNGMTLDELINQAVENAIKKYEDLEKDLLLLKAFVRQLSHIHYNQKVNANG